MGIQTKIEWADSTFKGRESSLWPPDIQIREMPKG